MKRELTAAEQRTMGEALKESVTVICPECGAADGHTAACITERVAFPGCPCVYVEPCKPTCSCAHPLQSGGCDRCCSYGSLEQRKETAEKLVKQIEFAAKTKEWLDKQEAEQQAWKEEQERELRLRAKARETIGPGHWACPQ